MSALRTLRNKQGRKPGMVSHMRALFPVARQQRMLGKGYSLDQRLAMWALRIKAAGLQAAA